MSKILHLQRKYTTLTETFIVNQINSLSNFEHSVFTIQFLDNLKSNANVFYPYNKQNGFDLKFLCSTNKKYFLKQFDIIKPALIHSHYLTDTAFFHSFTKKVNIPKICSCYGYDVSRFPNKYFSLAKYYFKNAFKEYDMFLAMSEDMQSDLISLGCPANKIVVHYHGIFTGNFNKVRNYQISSNTFNLLTVGSLEPKKAHIYILEALKILKAKYPAIKLSYTIVGAGKSETDLKNYVTTNHLDDVVDFKGLIKHGDEFNKILQDAHVFIHPSITTDNGDKEGIPGTIVEAMSSGLPVISTYHAGIPAVITDNVNGILVKERDSNAIADKILFLYKNEEQRKQIGEAAKKYALEQLDINIKSQNLEKIYNSLIYKL